MREPEADTPLGYLANLLELKKRAIETLKSIVGDAGVSRARADHHSYRKPRPCGITIHTGLGCTNGCLYCYAIDMGFPRVDKPYTLSPEELALAIAMNPYVVPERTLAAFGSVVEPFLPNTALYTASCISMVSKYLRLPCQVSTKMVLSDEVIRRLHHADPKLSLLVTVVTISKARTLEPNAPPPELRLESAKRAMDRGISATLFLRPLIPGLIEYEHSALLKLAKDYGLNTVVLGSLRVTDGILKRLSRAGLDVAKIVSRLPRAPRGPRDQVTVRCGDIKKLVKNEALKYGFTVFDTACQANIWSHDQYCAACDYGPCGDYSKEPKITESDVDELLEILGARAKCEVIDRLKVVIKGKLSSRDLEVLKQATRRVVKVLR